MTKRFNLVGSYLYEGNNVVSHFDDPSHRNEIVDLLNELAEENEQLKKQIERIDFILDDLDGAEYISRDDGIKALNKIDKVIGKR